MITERENVRNAYKTLLNEDPVKIDDEQPVDTSPAQPAPAPAPVTEPVAEPAPVTEPVAEPAPAAEKTKEIQSKVIAILSSKLMGDVKDKVYEMKFILKKTKDPRLFELISDINADIKEINEKILNTFNR